MRMVVREAYLDFHVDLVDTAVVLGNDCVSTGIGSVQFAHDKGGMVLFVFDLQTVHALQHGILQLPSNKWRRFSLYVRLDAQQLSHSHDFLLQILAIDTGRHFTKRNVKELERSVSIAEDLNEQIGRR